MKSTSINFHSRQSLAIVGCGPSTIYLLKHFLEEADFLKNYLSSITIFDREESMGLGMPYNPKFVDRYHMSNIPSEEMPPLLRSFADWLRDLSDDRLAALHILRAEIDESKIFSRIALGEYLQNQYQMIIARLQEAQIEIKECPKCDILDLQHDPATGVIQVVTSEGGVFEFDKVMVATGHQWPATDRPKSGYFSSPWPVIKFLSKAGETYNYPIGTLGASLSAFDVVTSLAHRHGQFLISPNGYEYLPDPGTEKFRITMFAGNGRLPHLRYAIAKSERKIYQHVSRVDLLKLVDTAGFLRFNTYFDEVCRPALRQAFKKDGLDEIVDLLKQPSFTIHEFVDKMSEEHTYEDAFAGMIEEMKEARESVYGKKPIYWKEVIDDLIYTLNFHAELLPAEDHIVLHSVILPFLMNVIAAMPLHSADRLLALHAAGKLEMIAGKVSLPEQQSNSSHTTILLDDGEKKNEMTYRMFIDCSGQKMIDLPDYPFPSLLKSGGIRQARARFAQEGNVSDLKKKDAGKVFYEEEQPLYATGGIEIDGLFQVVGKDGVADGRIYDIAFPHSSGVRPYSYGLQSCSDTGDIVTRGLIEEFKKGQTADTDETKIYEKI